MSTNVPPALPSFSGGDPQPETAVVKPSVSTLPMSGRPAQRPAAVAVAAAEAAAGRPARVQVPVAAPAQRPAPVASVPVQRPVQPAQAAPAASQGVPVQRPAPVAAPAVPVQRPVQPAQAAAPAPVAPAPVASAPGHAPFSARKAQKKQATSEWLFNFLNELGTEGMSDLHVHPGVGMWKLIDGKLNIINGAEYVLDEEDILQWMEHSEGYLDHGVDAPEKLLGEKGHTTLAFYTGEWRVRGSFRRSTVGVSATFRLIPSKIPSVEDVYLPQAMVDMIKTRSGLIIIEGPTGSGKSTSVAALINYINVHDNLHIYSIEDPIEFHHTPEGSTVFTMREIGLHASDYASAVENALRSKPNIIFIGEMLSNATKHAALHAATTGHLVITTAHAGSVVEALDSFIGGFPAEEQPQIRARLATSIRGVMCQTLVATKSGKLVAVREIMTSNMNFEGLIMSGEMNMIPAQLESSPGCISMEKALADLVQQGVVDVEVALNTAKKRDTLREELVRLGVIGADDFKQSNMKV